MSLGFTENLTKNLGRTYANIKTNWKRLHRWLRKMWNL